MYDVVIIGAGPGGIYSAYELIKLNKGLKIVVLEEGNPLEKRKCPIDGKRSEEHTSELQSLRHRVCRLLLEKTLQRCSIS